VTAQLTNKTLVYRLRSAGKRMPEAEIDGGALMNEAADEIERLERLYIQAVQGRREFRQALRDEREEKRGIATEQYWKDKQGDEYGSY